MNDLHINSVSLFEDLKNTNIKITDFKEILASYKQLEDKYIKDNEVDLLRDLNKQKKVIFSYFDTCYNASIKKTASMVSEIEREFGNFDEIDTFNSPNKDINFVKIAYKDGKWIVSMKNLSEGLTIKDIPQGINNLVELVDRMDEQEAAYALCHAKTAGKFVLAALPYVRTDMPDTLWTTRYMKEPTVPLGPYEKSEDSVSTHNMPVSRQFASEDDNKILMGDRIETEDGDLYEIVAVSENQIITSQNETIDKMLAEGKLQSGEWKKVESAKDDKEDIKVIRLKQKMEKLTSAWEEKLVLDESIERLVSEYRAKLTEAAKEKINKLEEARASAEPKLISLMSKLDSIREQDNKAFRKFQNLKEKVGKFTLGYSREVEMTRIKGANEVEEVLEKMEKYVSPRNLKSFTDLEAEMFKTIQREEQFSISLTQKDPRNEELIQEQMEELKKKIQTSQNSEFERDAAYDELDNLLIDGELTFKQYSDFTDFADVNAKEVLASLKCIKAGLKEVKADFISDIWQKIKDFYNGVKEWIVEKLPFITIQEKEVKDINEDLDQILGE